MGLYGGPASRWNYPERWDEYVARAHATLQSRGATLVPHSECSQMMLALTMHRDGVHFENSTSNREALARILAHWILPFFDSTSANQTWQSTSVRDTDMRGQ